jgi:hypothetical protein
MNSGLETNFTATVKARMAFKANASLVPADVAVTGLPSLTLK